MVELEVHSLHALRCRGAPHSLITSSDIVVLQNLIGSFRDPPRKKMSVSGGRGLFEPSLTANYCGLGIVICFHGVTVLFVGVVFLE